MCLVAQGGPEAPGRLEPTGPAKDYASSPGSRPPRLRLRAGRSTGRRRTLKALYPNEDAGGGPQRAGSHKASGRQFPGALQLSSSDEELAAPAPPPKRVLDSENETPSPGQAPAEALGTLKDGMCAAAAGLRPLKRLRRVGALPTHVQAGVRDEAASAEEGANPDAPPGSGDLGRARSCMAGWDSQSSSDSKTGGIGAGSAGAMGHWGGSGRLQGDGQGGALRDYGAESAAAAVGAGNPFLSARTLEHGRQVRH